mgnify:CR=1 FL=1
MERTEIVSLFKNTPADGTEITVCGWAKNIRDSKNIGFIALSDGGCFKTLQVVLEAGKLANYDEVIHTGLYSSLRVKGKLVLTPQAKQPFELNADSVEILGDCPADEYPLQKKKMSMEYLRTMPTLRPRTNTFNAAFRVRSVAAYAIHNDLCAVGGDGFVRMGLYRQNGAGDSVQVLTSHVDQLGQVSRRPRGKAGVAVVVALIQHGGTRIVALPIGGLDEQGTDARKGHGSILHRHGRGDGRSGGQVHLLGQQQRQHAAHG